MYWFEPWAVVAIVAIGTGFVLKVIKMGIEHTERMEKIKRGYPLDSSTPNTVEKEYIDYRGDREN